MNRTTPIRSSTRRAAIAAQRTAVAPSSPPCTPFSKGLKITSSGTDAAAAVDGQEPQPHLLRALSTKNRSSVQLDFGTSTTSSSSAAAAVKPAGAPRQASSKPAADASAAASSTDSSSSSSSEIDSGIPFQIDFSSYVLKLQIQDLNEARQAVAHARRLRRPLLLQGLLTETVKNYTPDHLQLLPEDVKVCSDDKSGIGFQPLRDWGVAPKRLRKATAAAASAAPTSSTTATGEESIPYNWGRIASIMSEKAPQARLWTRFMQDDLASFRASTGHTALASFAASVFEGRSPMSCNVIVTGNAAPTASGRRFELKSDAHQDEYDNFMLVSSGAKIWALASLTEEQVLKGRKTKGKLSSSFRLDAVDRTKNRTREEHEIAGCFETVWMGPGDVLYNPAWVWHQVNSEPQTLAYSIMHSTNGKEEKAGETRG